MRSVGVGAFAGRRERVSLHSGGGLLAIGGPPLGGKSVLAARITECLPQASKLESIDNLEFARERLQPSRSADRSKATPQRDLLARAKELLAGGPAWSAPVVVIACRFATPAARRSARAVARAAGVRFLFVEARSRDIRALRRIPMSFLSPQELKQRTARYERALREYQRITPAEARLLPGLCLTQVLSDLDPAVERVLAAWRSMGAA